MPHVLGAHLQTKR